MNKNITRDERIQIKSLLDQGYKAPYIASYIGRNKTSVYRELSKVNSSGIYDYDYADSITKCNMVRHRHQAPSAETIAIIEQKILEKQWSPEQISGWLLLNHDISISHTWIYSYIAQDQKAGGELYNHMRRGKYNYEPKEYKGKIKNRKSINDRPEVINKRERLGDVEIDLIVGPKNKGAILTAVDRLSRLCILKKLDSKHANVVKNSVINTLKEYSTLSITSDNGNEFMNHEQIASALSLDYYFANPYASFERGSIENLNGLIRQYIPKGMSFDDIDDDYIQIIQDKLNTRPRKILNFLTPAEFTEKMKAQGSSELRLQV